MADGLNVNWVGVKEFQRRMDELIAERQAATKTALAAAAHVVEAIAKDNLRIGTHKKNEPTTSAPGTPPDLVTGTLRRSVTVKGPTATGPGAWRAEVGPTVIYGRIQELGGVTGEGHAAILPPRPYMEPSLEEAAPTIQGLFWKAWSGGG